MLGRVVATLRESVLLRAAEARSSKMTERQRRSIQAYHAAALRRLSVADGLRLPNAVPAALSLYREGGWLLAVAFLTSIGHGEDVDALGGGAAFEALEQALERERLKAPPAFAMAKQVLGAADAVALDRLTAENADRSLSALSDATRWLSTLVEPRSPRELRLARQARTATVSAGAAAALVGLAVWIASPRNLALNKPARSSSAGYDTAPAGAVDGEKNGRFGFHSQDEDSPWLSIDLKRPSDIKKIKVFGRGDCCGNQSVPLALEVSDDGESFRKIAERTEDMSEEDPWVVTPEPLVTRFVRLRTERHSVLVLSEVEIYGRAKLLRR